MCLHDSQYYARFHKPLPFSSRYMLQENTYCDQMGIRALSHFWGAKITVVKAVNPRFNEHRFRHDRPLPEAELVLVHNGRLHFFAACELHDFTYCVRCKKITINLLLHDGTYPPFSPSVPAAKNLRVMACLPVEKTPGFEELKSPGRPSQSGPSPSTSGGGTGTLFAIQDLERMIKDLQETLSGYARFHNCCPIWFAIAHLVHDFTFSGNMSKEEHKLAKKKSSDLFEKLQQVKRAAPAESAPAEQEEQDQSEVKATHPIQSIHSPVQSIHSISTGSQKCSTFFRSRGSEMRPRASLQKSQTSRKIRRPPKPKRAAWYVCTILHLMYDFTKLYTAAMCK